jgi:CBS domain-containing protein
MKVKEIMRPARVISKESNVRDAAKMMNKHRIGSLIVVDDNKRKVAGIITERDILEKVTAGNKLASKVKVEDIMTKKVISISPESYIDDAVYIMIQHKIKKLPVVNNGELVGILTSSDILTNSEDIGQFYIFD